MKNLCRLSGMILLIYIISSCEKKPITPSVSTPTILTAIKNITQTTATFEGLVMDNGGGPIYARGVCWSTTEDPTIEQNNIIEINPAGSFTGFIDNLNPNTLYYFRAFAVDSAGIGYGNTISITTLLSVINFNPNLTYGIVTDIENNKYKTITIGTQFLPPNPQLYHPRGNLGNNK